MEKLLRGVKKSLEAELINESQALYLLYKHREMDYPIDAVDLLELTKNKFIVNNTVGRRAFLDVDADFVLSGNILPKYETELSKELTLHLCSLVCVKDPKNGKIKLPGSDNTIEDTATNYLGGEGLIAYHYLIFLFMFPVKGSTNKRWEKHFNNGKEYKGAKLRTRCGSTATKFKRIAEVYDMGVFLYGTYLYIQSCIQDDKPYIKTIRNYMLEFRDWYDEANEEMGKVKTVKELFKRNRPNNGPINVMI